MGEAQGGDQGALGNLGERDAEFFSGASRRRRALRSQTSQNTPFAAFTREYVRGQRIAHGCGKLSGWRSYFDFQLYKQASGRQRDNRQSAGRATDLATNRQAGDYSKTS